VLQGFEKVRSDGHEGQSNKVLEKKEKCTMNQEGRLQGREKEEGDWGERVKIRKA